MNDIEREGRTGADQLFFGRHGNDAIGHGVRLLNADRHPLIEMQFARTPIIIEPIGHVVVLLDFHQRHPASNRMHRSRGYIIEAAPLDRFPFHQRLDASIQRGIAQFLARQILYGADTKLGIGRGIQYIPAFGFSAGHPVLPGLFVVRVDLNGQLFTCEDIFDQERKVAVLFRSEPDFTDASIIDVAM